MKLTDLDAEFIGNLTLGPTGNALAYDHVGTLAEAQGVMFQCPKCAMAHGGKVEEEDGRRFVRGAHMVLCWFVGKVPDTVDPKPGRWIPSGTGLHDLTFVGPGAASVQLLGGGCDWHGFVRNGEATES